MTKMTDLIKEIKTKHTREVTTGSKRRHHKKGQRKTKGIHMDTLRINQGNWKCKGNKTQQK